MQVRIECLYRSQHGLQVHGCYNIGMVKAILKAFREHHSVGCHELCTVDQGQSFLWSQIQGGKSGHGKEISCRYSFSVIKDTTVPDEG